MSKMSKWTRVGQYIRGKGKGCGHSVVLDEGIYSDGWAHNTLKSLLADANLGARWSPEREKDAIRAEIAEAQARLDAAQTKLEKME